MLAQQPEKNVPEPGASYRASETRVRPLRVIAREIRNTDWRGIGIVVLVAIAITGAFFGVSALGDAPRKLERLILLAAAFWTSIIAAAWASGRGKLLFEAVMAITVIVFARSVYHLFDLFDVWAERYDPHVYGALGGILLAMLARSHGAGIVAMVLAAFAMMISATEIADGRLEGAPPILLRGVLMLGAGLIAAAWLRSKYILAACFVAGVWFNIAIPAPLLQWLLAPDLVLDHFRSAGDWTKPWGISLAPVDHYIMTWFPLAVWAMTSLAGQESVVARYGRTYGLIAFGFAAGMLGAPNFWWFEGEVAGFLIIAIVPSATFLLCAPAMLRTDLVAALTFFVLASANFLSGGAPWMRFCFFLLASGAFAWCLFDGLRNRRISQAIWGAVFIIPMAVLNLVFALASIGRGFDVREIVDVIPAAILLLSLIVAWVTRHREGGRGWQ